MDLASLVRASRNPRQHDLGALHASLSRFGFVNPILVDDRTGRIVAGHGRLDALQQRKAAGGEAPAHVQVANGSWRVPVVRGVGFANDTEAEGALIALNRTTELGGWDAGELAMLLSDLAAQDALDGTGYDAEDLDGLLASLSGAAVGPETDCVCALCGHKHPRQGSGE